MFLKEASELLGFVNELLVSLRDSSTDEIMHSKLFRYIHTLRGSSYSSGFSSLAAFAYQLEMVLERIQSRDLNANEKVIDLLLESNTLMMHHIKDLSGDLCATLDCETLSSELKLLTDIGNGRQPEAHQLFRFEEMGVNEVVDSVIIESSHVPLQLLVVDDEEDIRSILCEVCEEIMENCIVDVAQDGKEGVEYLQKNRYDLIITDLKMPHDGLSLIENTREIYPDVPIIVISGFADRDDLIRCIDLGIDNFIEKPLQREIVVFSIKNSINNKLLKDKSTLLTKQAFKTYMSFQNYLIEQPDLSENQAKVRFDEMNDNCDALSKLSQQIFFPTKP